MLFVVAIAIIAAGVSAFVLMPSESAEVAPVIQEPMVEKSQVPEEEVSVLDTNNLFPAPTLIAQSMKAAQPAPNVTIGDDGKIYVLYQLSLIHI